MIPKISPRINPTEVLSHFKNPAAILPVFCVELFTTSGRTAESYKRGGKVEAKETLFEDGLAAIIWLYGVKTFNALGNAIGKGLGFKHLGTDVGKDALRNPFASIPKDKQLSTALFKFSKIFASVLLATSITGFVLPKVKHRMTQKIQKENKPSSHTQNSATPKTATFAPFALPSIAEFLSNAKNNTQKTPKNPQTLSFKGFVDNICRISHNLENNNTWRLLSTDTGMIAGRVKNSRNKVEAGEFLFRDTASIYFYMFATPHVVKLLNKATKSIDIHPKALAVLQEHLKNQVKKNKTPLEVESFVKKAFGGLKTEIPEHITSKLDKDGIIALRDFNTATSSEFALKAKLMSELQPRRDGVSILSKQQVQDILSDKWTSDPKFLKKALHEATYGASDDASKFVSREKVEGIRKNIDDFAEQLAQYAKKQGGNDVTEELIEKFAKQGFGKSALFYALGFGVSVLGLAVMVPKLKNYITKMRTGQDSFPGVTEYE